MTHNELFADYTKALNLASFDASRGEPRWLRELIALAETRAIKYPHMAKAYRAAAKKAAKHAA